MIERCSTLETRAPDVYLAAVTIDHFLLGSFTSAFAHRSVLYTLFVQRLTGNRTCAHRGPTRLWDIASVASLRKVLLQALSVPGAVAQMQGTYNLITEKINLHGTLKTDSAPSNTKQGMKGLLLKVLDPFFKRKRAGYAMPVKITGTYEHPSFRLDLGDRDDKAAREETARASQLLKGAKH